MGLIYTNVKRSKQKKKPGWKQREAEYQAHLKKLGIDPSKPKKRKQEFVTLKSSPSPIRGEDHREKYPSLMERQIAEGTFCQKGITGTKQEPMKYTGTLIKGIATMHKSNAVPVIDEQHAKDIARMRR